MELQEFDQFDDDARLWVYGFAKPLAEADRKVVTERLSSFVQTWSSHKIPVTGAFAMVHDRFLLIAGATPEGLSGCSIDSSIENLKYLADHHGLDGLNRSLVFFRNDAGDIECRERGEFQPLVDSGVVGPASVVFDTTIQTVGDLRAGRFETTFQNTWHAKAFPINDKAVRQEG